MEKLSSTYSPSGSLVSPEDVGGDPRSILQYSPAPTADVNAVEAKKKMVVNIFTKQIRQQEDETGRGHTPNSLHGVISPRNEELPQLRDYPSAKYELFSYISLLLQSCTGERLSLTRSWNCVRTYSALKMWALLSIKQLLTQLRRQLPIRKKKKSRGKRFSNLWTM